VSLYTQVATPSGATLLQHGGTARSKRVISVLEVIDGSYRNDLPRFLQSDSHEKLFAKAKE